MSDDAPQIDTTAPDPVLAGYLSAFFGDRDEQRGNSFSLTVNAGGILVTGTAITRFEWVDLLVQSYEDSGHAAFAAGLRESSHPDDGEEAPDDEPAPSREYLNMKDVTLWVGSERIGLPIWRVRLRDVSGWTPAQVS